jgi:hypothetical protein
MKFRAQNSASNPVDFNREWAQSVKEAEFVKHLFPLLWQDLPDAERKAELVEAYRVLNGKPVKEAPTKETPAKGEQPANENEGAQ